MNDVVHNVPMSMNNDTALQPVFHWLGDNAGVWPNQ